MSSHGDQEAVSLLQQGLGLHQKGQLAQAKAIYERLLEKQPRHFDALHLLGVIASQARNPALAAELIGKAIEINPDSAPAYSNRGNALKDLKRLDEALASYDKAIALKPDYADALYNRGNALKELKRLDEALASYDQATAIKPDYAHAFNNRGNVLEDLKRLAEALASYDQAIAIKPDYVDAFNNRGNALKDLKRLDEALASYDQAIALKPDYADAFNNRGNALQELKRLDEALASCDQAIAIKPGYADAFNNRGVALRELKRLDEALASYDQAISLKPDYADAFNNLGNALKDLKRLDEALASYDKAIAIKPGYADAFYNRGIALHDLHRLEEALASYDRAVAIKPDYADAFNNRGNVLTELDRRDDALASYDKAIASRPGYEFLFGTRLHTQMHLCDWSGLSGQLHQLESALAGGLRATPPFPVLGLIDNPGLQFMASKNYVEAKYPESRVPGDFAKPDPGKKIRIGYYSADFHNHATSHLMAELFEAHDPRRFELYGFSFGPDKQDEMRNRISEGFDRFFDVTNKSDRDVARMSRDLGIDIAVDLKGFTQDSRPGIFAGRCAPIQVNYLGYPGTMGAAYMDYLIADKILIPQDSRQHYSEKIVYLPHSYQVNDSRRKISDQVFTRKELGLPESGFVFCCFNNNYKILPTTFDGWMRLLKAVDGSVLWLFEGNPTAARNLRREAEIRGVDPGRLVFAKRMKLEHHLARHRVADLFIDTLPCNAHTTTSDALWAGLPVLTLIGKSFAARVAASLLTAMDLPELITGTQEQYESRAIELAKNPLQLAGIKAKVERNRQTSPLFNGQLFARHIEAAYAKMHGRYLSGEQPDHIHMDA